jgi:hypothetical protein
LNFKQYIVAQHLLFSTISLIAGLALCPLRPSQGFVAIPG